MQGTNLDVEPLALGEPGLKASGAPNPNHQGFAAPPKPAAFNDFQPPSNDRVFTH